MSLSFKDALAYLGRIKNIGLIAAALILGKFLCTIDSDFSFNNSGGVNSTEKDIAELCREVIGSEPYVSVNSDQLGTITGIAIVIDGKENDSVKLKLTEMLATLYSISSSRIYVTESLCKT